jgi:hypothetical protein
MPRKFKFYLVTLIVVIAALELESWGFATLATRFGILHFYSADLFERVTDQQLTHDSELGPLGWSSDNVPRPAPPENGEICGSAFGDSFTFGGEVKDQEAWVHLLADRLSCKVMNYGVSGYGIDQAVLRYEQIAPEGKFVILGLFLEMLRRDVAASWTFYGSGEPPYFSKIKPYFTVEGNALHLHPIPKPLTRESISLHHANDYYMHHVWTAAKFPYIVQIAHALYIRVFRAGEYRLLADASWGSAHPSGSGLLARHLADRFIHAALDRKKHVVIVLMPHVSQLFIETPLYQQFVDDLRRHEDVCVIDTKSNLRRQARVLGLQPLSAPNKHYNALGNQIIAEAVAEGLKQCNIMPETD